MGFHEAKIFIKGKSGEIYSIAKEMERYPDFMKDVEKVTVLRREGNKTTTEWITSVEDTPIYWKEEDQFDDEERVITYRLLEGDLDKFEGMWSFVEDSEGTNVTLTVDYDFGVPMLAELIGPTLDQKVRENCAMMLEGMKKKVEGE